MGRYDDILNTHWPRPTSRPRMSIEDRAAQFAPFAALTGYDDVLTETARLTQRPVFLTEESLEELNRQATQLIWTMNASVDNAFADFDRQRGELQQYVTREREALVEQLRATGDELVRTTLDAVPGLVGKILLYLVLALAVLIGGPFALGFWLGGVRAKARIKNEKLKMKN